jgi:hypothetical protein
MDTAIGLVVGLGGASLLAHVLMRWDERRRSKLTPEERREQEALDDEMWRW